MAMSIAYGLALSWGWEKPMWAGFVVAFCSLATIGQSFTKAALRMSGTLLGAGASLLFVALFPQERWLFMGILSVFIGVCTYMMAGPKNPYFWNVAGLVSVIVCMDTGPDPTNAFSMAVLRAEETGLGILVYSVVALLLWPASSRSVFVDSVHAQAEAHRQLLIACFERITQPEAENEVPSLKAQVLQGQTRFAQLLAAAVADTYEVWEDRQAWQVYRGLVFKLTETVERWSQNVAEIQLLDLARLLPNLSAFSAELDQRFVQIERMLKGEDPPQQPEAVALALDQSELKALPHFQRAAVVVAWKRLKELDGITQSMFEQVGGIKGFGPLTVSEVAASRTAAAFDPDRGLAAFRAMLTLWLAYLALIYVDCIPGGSGLVSMAGPLGMIFATSPQLRVNKLAGPVIFGVICASLIYLCIMPRLSSYQELGLLIFVVVFGFCYFFAAPKQMLVRAFGLAMFISIASISNEQSYSFMVVAGTALMFPLLFVLLLVTANIPFLSRPDRAMLRLLRRFFRSYEYLLAAPKSDSWMAGQRKNFHLHEVASLPEKIGSWAPGLDEKILGGTTKELVQAMLASVQSLSFRMTELLEERNQLQSPALEKELQTDFIEWRKDVQDVARQLSADPASGDHQQFSSRLAGIRERLEVRMAALASLPEERVLSLQDAERFYHLLGAYRGLSEALVDYAGNTGAINWTPWREERFY